MSFEHELPPPPQLHGAAGAEARERRRAEAERRLPAGRIALWLSALFGALTTGGFVFLICMADLVRGGNDWMNNDTHSAIMVLVIGLGILGQLGGFGTALYALRTGIGKAAFALPFVLTGAILAFLLYCEHRAGHHP